MFAISESDEYYGLTGLEHRMYLKAWEHNADCLGFAGLCNLWYQEINQTITLENISRVWQKLNEYSYFKTASYWYNRISGTGSGTISPDYPWSWKSKQIRKEVRIMDYKPEFYRIIARDPNMSGHAWAEHIKEFKPLGDGRVLVTDLHGGCYFADLNDIVADVQVIRKISSSNICKIMLEG